MNKLARGLIGRGGLFSFVEGRSKSKLSMIIYFTTAYASDRQ
jgi:hypothetical protein